MLTDAAASVIQVFANLILSVLCCTAFGLAMPDFAEIMALISIYLIAMIIGPVMGIIVMRFGRIGYYGIVVVLTGILGGIVGFAKGYMPDGGVNGGGRTNIVGMAVKAALGTGNGAAAAYIAIVTVCAALIVLAGWLLVHASRKTEVRV